MKIVDKFFDRLIDSRIDSLADKLFHQDIDLKSDRAAAAITSFLSGYPAPQRGIPSRDMILYEAVAWVYTGISRVVDSLIEVPLEARKYIDGNEYEVIDSGDEFSVFNPPNPDTPYQEYIAKTACDLLLAGGSYSTIEPGTTKADKWEIYHRLNPYMKPIVGNSKDVISHYLYQENGSPVRYEREEVIDIRLPNPNSHFHGQSAVQPTRPAIQLHEAVQSLFADYFKHTPFFGMAFLTEGPVGEEAKDRFKKDLKAKYAKGSVAIGNSDDERRWNRFDPLVLNKVTPVSLSQGISSVQYDVVTERSIMSILSAIGTPPAIVGLLKHANYSNMDAQLKIFWRYRLKPLLSYMEAGINLRVPAIFGNPKLRWEFNTKSIDALQDDKGEVTTRTVAAYNAGIVMLNEARIDIGKDPVDGGDIFKPAPVSPFAGFTEEDQDESNDDDDKGALAYVTRPGRPGNSHTPAAANPKGAPLIKSAAYIKRKTSPFRKIMAGFFRNELERLLDKYNELTNDATLLTTLRPFTKDIPDNADDLFDGVAEAGLLNQATGKFVKQTVGQAAQNAISSIGIDEVFDVTNPRVMAFIENGLSQMTKDVTKTTWQEIQGVLSTGYEGGATSREIRDSLTELFERWYKPGPGQVGVEDRCMRIARTEMGKFVHGGQFQAYREASDAHGLNLVKIWIHSRSANAREDHVMLDGVSVGLKEQFDVGGFPADYPNDPNLPAEHTINCRCDYIVQEIE